MTNYKFSTDKFALSEKSLHFLRGRFNYDTVDFMQINEIIIDKGAQINNWLIALIIGLVLIIGPVFLFTFSFLKGEIHNMGMSVELGILPFIFGLAATYQALRRGYVLKIKYNYKIVCLPIQQFSKNKLIDSLIQFLKTNPLTKNKLTIATDNL